MSSLFVVSKTMKELDQLSLPLNESSDNPQLGLGSEWDAHRDGCKVQKSELAKWRKECDKAYVIS